MTPGKACRRSWRSASPSGSTASASQTMDFAFDATTLQLRERLLAFMDECVYPAEQRFREEVEQADDRWGSPPVIEALKAQARERGLWNLFLPPIHEHGAGLTNLQY